jgi:predicted phage baseplate assembly protein
VSQETLIGVLARLADRDPSALDALEAMLARSPEEDDQAYSRRMDHAATFLDQLVAGLAQHARDQVVLLHGSAALARADAATPGHPAWASQRGIAQPGTDALYLEPDSQGTLTSLLAPGDWLVVGADSPATRDAGAVAREFHQAVQVVRLEDRVPPGRIRPSTLVTFHPPLVRRYRLDDTVILGNILQISHGETVRESGVRDAAAGPLRPSQVPLTWLRDPAPQAVAGRRAQVTLTTGGREWQQVAELGGHRPGEPVFTVRTEPAGTARLDFGDDREGASLGPGAEFVLRYRVGIGTAGDQPVGGIVDLASSHPAVLDTFNPLPVTGGADPEPFEVTRQRARTGLPALARAVSARDVAALATTFGGVRQATVASGVPGRRHRLSIVVCSDDGSPLDPAVLADLSAFLTARMPPGTGVRVHDRRLVGVRAAISLAIEPGADPLPVLAAAQVCLGARSAAGVAPGLLDPRAAVLGRSLSISDLYRALAGVPGLRGAVVTALHRHPHPPARLDRVVATPADLLVWAPTGQDVAIEPLALSWAQAVDL